MDWETTIKTLRMAVDCIGPTITALGAIALFFKRVRKYLYLVFIHKPEMDRRLYDKVAEILNRIGKIESELRLNDDSTVKDAVARLEAYRRYSATNSMSLIFELDKIGNIVLVTDALCQLVETVRAEDLKGQNWRQFRLYRRRTQSDGQPVHRCENRLVHPDESPRHQQQQHIQRRLVCPA